MSASPPSSGHAFSREREDASMNQYWYSPATIEQLVASIQLHGRKVAFLSTPSLYFSLTSESVKQNSKVFEFDRRWAEDPGFVFYDYNRPEEVPVSCWEAFDMIVVDPPFITREVWANYITTVKLIAKKEKDGGCKFLFTSVLENHEMLEELIDDPLYVAAFQPSIPHLTYQYHTFVNYPLDAHLGAPNPELPAEDVAARKRRLMLNDLRESEIAFTHQMRSREGREGEEMLPALARARKRQAQLDSQSSSSAAGGVAASRGDEVPISAMKWSYVPAGLTEYAPGGADPVAAAPAAPKSAAYERLSLRRNLMEEYKKLVDGVVKQVDKLIQFREKAAAKAGAAAAAASTTATMEYPAELVQPRDASLARMNAIADELATLDELDATTVCRTIRTCAGAYQTAHSLTSAGFREMCADATRLYKSPVFNRQKELLAAMKEETKATAAAIPQPTAAAAASA